MHFIFKNGLFHWYELFKKNQIQHKNLDMIEKTGSLCDVSIHRKLCLKLLKQEYYVVTLSVFYGACRHFYQT